MVVLLLDEQIGNELVQIFKDVIGDQVFSLHDRTDFFYFFLESDSNEHHYFLSIHFIEAD